MNISLKVITHYQNKDIIKDYAPVLSEASYTTNRKDSPGCFSFTLIEQQGIDIEMGSCVYVQLEEQNFFKGYVFSAERQRNRKVKYTAYDQLRYLKAKASYTFIAQSVEDIIRQIASDFGLKVGKLANTEYKIPSLIKENEGCIDTIFDALEILTVKTGKFYIFYDDYGELTLTEVKDHIWNKIVGDKSLLNDYSYKRSIDSDTYNRIKLARPNKETGKADVYVYEDSDTIGQWGLLQYYEVFDEGANSAQLEEMCKSYLQYYNKVWQTLELKKIIGYPEIRAGWVIPVRIADIDIDLVEGKPRFFLAEKVTHKIKGNSHTMDIEIKNFNNPAGGG